MIKDIMVSLEHKIARDPARDFAITIAETFDTHVVGVAFAYAPDFRGLRDAGYSTRYRGPDDRREREKPLWPR